MSRLPARAPATAARQRGVGLIEVLVSVLVVSIGLLGAVALQAAALRNNQGSYERTQAGILTQGILDAMRANLDGVNAGQYDTGGFICTAPNTTNLATRDLARWIGDLQAQMNGGACGQVACATGACTITVRWDDSRAAGGSSAQTMVVRAQL